jgi:threonylcarbamoyladenosine tRNA methylthiotransferase MtaB
MSLADVSAQAASIASAGYREIVITGIEISSYGVDMKNGTTLIDAIRAVSDAAPDIRIRIGSLEPRTASEEFCRQASLIPNLCDHFHLSLQSGCDATLKRMRRKYDTALYYSSVCNLRKYFPDCAITTDLIVGFPGETQADFDKSVDFLKKCRFADAHIFPYSPRPGTPAADMDGQISKDEKHRRALAAAQQAQRLHDEYALSFVGRELDVLFEQEKNGWSSGHAKNYLKVRTNAEGMHNIVRTVHIIDYIDSELCGIIAQQ